MTPEEIIADTKKGAERNGRFVYQAGNRYLFKRNRIIVLMQTPIKKYFYKECKKVGI